MRSAQNLFFLLRSCSRHPLVPREEIVQFQNQRLRALVQHAYRRVPFYQKLFDRHGINPGDIQTAADLQALPTITKKDLAELPWPEKIARGIDPDRLIPDRCSGTTGQPFEVRRTWLEMRALNAPRRRLLRQYGIHPRDRGVRIIEEDPISSGRRLAHLYLLQRFGFFRYRLIDCRQPLEQILELLRAYKPQNVRGYAGVVAQVAQRLGPEDRKRMRITCVLTSAETLTPIYRRQIAEGFGAPVFDTYGCNEFNLLAWECARTGAYHVCDDGVILEVIKDGRPAAMGESGEVVVTGLHSFAMPLIRYRLADVVVKGDERCACGQPFSTLQAIQGRSLEYFRFPGGRMVHPFDLNTAFLFAYSWIRQFQLEQVNEQRIVLRLVTTEDPSPDNLSTIRERLRALTGPDVQVDIETVDGIKPEPSGKIRVFKPWSAG